MPTYFLTSRWCVLLYNTRGDGAQESRNTQQKSKKPSNTIIHYTKRCCRSGIGTNLRTEHPTCSRPIQHMTRDGVVQH